MTPRLRLVYSAAICSFIPYTIKTGLAPYSKMTSYRDCTMMGSMNGILITALCLSFKPGYVVGGALIGGGQGLIHCRSLKHFSSKNNQVSEDKYVDKDFKLV